jgi:hypothetical protein
VDGDATEAARAVPSVRGERLLSRCTANHIRDGRAYEGYLYVTTVGLIFAPWSASAARGAVPFDLPLDEVAGADVAPRGSNWRDGSWRRRLRVTRTSGVAELFVVWQAPKVAALIEQALRGLPEAAQ